MRSVIARRPARAKAREFGCARIFDSEASASALPLSELFLAEILAPVDDQSLRKAEARLTLPPVQRPFADVVAFAHAARIQELLHEIGPRSRSGDQSSFYLSVSLKMP